MMRLEILDNKDRVLSTHKLGEELTLLGQSPGAHIHLSGKDVGPLHVGIKRTNGKTMVMDLGGPELMKVNGRSAVEKTIDDEVTMLDIGSRRVRIVVPKHTWPELQKQKWDPVIERREGRRGAGAAAAVVIRTRLYLKNIPQNAVNTQTAFYLGPDQGVAQLVKTLWIEGQKAFVQLPREWLQFKGRIKCGDSILELASWATKTELEQDKVYKVYAGAFLLEIMVSKGQLVIGNATHQLLPKELRRPLGISLASVLVFFALWQLMFLNKETKVEEPYQIYARIQNVPMEKVPDPEPSASQPQAGGGSGSEATETTAPTLGAPTQSAPSKAAQALTGGLKNLIGNVLSSAQVTNTVVAENGIGQVAAAGGGKSAVAGKLASVGQGASNVAGATKLGNLAIAGSGKGFSGGSGTGLGTGHGSGVGTGVGDGIGRGGYKLVEEESIVDGGLDKSVIAAIIQNKLGQIKYCYERQLVAEPDLFGKVVVRWIINAAGAVEAQTVKQTTLNSPPVEQCMLGKISGWQFPQPKNGSKVTVTYPFLFKSTK